LYNLLNGPLSTLTVMSPDVGMKPEIDMASDKQEVVELDK